MGGPGRSGSGAFRVGAEFSRNCSSEVDLRRVADRWRLPDVITIYIHAQNPAMAHYRIYGTTPDGRVTAPPTVVECDDDQKAIGKAAQFVDGQALELGREPAF